MNDNKLLKQKSVIFRGYWNVNICRNNKNCLFIFGDNDMKYGKKGQSIIRDELNSIGIPTKKKPRTDSSSFYTDLEYYNNVRKINDAINYIVSISSEYDIIYFPENPLGTGLAKLDKYAPKTYKKMCEIIYDNFGIYYD